jgi:molybdopterin-guanine dinucleotide biosynthesis protein A
LRHPAVPAGPGGPPRRSRGGRRCAGRHGRGARTRSQADAAPALRPQPVFCLLRTDLRDSLRRYTEAGGRKVHAWTAQHRTVLVPFDRPGDAPQAFFNANTLPELHALENR